MKLPNARKPFFLISLAVLLLLLIFASPAGIVHAANGTIQVNVFRDYNANGTQDTREPGMGGISVSIYDSTNAQVGSTETTFGIVCAGSNSPAGQNCTGAGAPSLGSLGVGTSSPPFSVAPGTYRVEFTGLPGYLQEGAFGTNSGTNVQFITVPDGGSVTVSQAVNNPSQYCQTNPTLVTCQFIFGDNVTGAHNTDPNVVSFPYNSSANPPAPTTQVVANQVGSVWGVAYSPNQTKIYVSAFMKRGAGFGPAASNPQGQIYQITPGSGVATNFANISNTGTNLHSNMDCTGTNDCDLAAFNSGTGANPPGTNFSPVGKAALGALIINDDQTLMFTVNLFNGHLYEITVPGAVVTDRGAIPNNCNAANSVARPFGLGFRDGTLYVGGVCDAGISQNKADLSAYVYTYNPTAHTFSANPVLTFPLNYTRTCANFSNSAPLYVAPIPVCRSPSQLGPLAAWNPWTDNISTAMTSTTFQNGVSGGSTVSLGGSYPMPMLTKIQFDNNDMIIGLRDRFGDMYGDSDPGPARVNPIKDGTTNISQSEVPAGDLLRANPCPHGSASCSATADWQLESAGKSNPNGIFTGPVVGQTSGQGPTSGEFYCEEWMLRHHDETSWGGVLQIPGFGQVTETAQDPVDVAFTGGVIQLSNTTGTCTPPSTALPDATAHGTQRVNSYQVYANNPNSTFAKANGLGDLVALCNAAPIELGNRLWFDKNNDGIQEPGEVGIPGVVIELRLTSSGASIGSVTTDANGGYTFSSGAGTNSTGHAYNLAGLLTGTGFTIRIDMTLAANLTAFAAAGIVGTPTLSPANVSSGANSDIRNSSATLSGNFATINLTTGTAGANDHNEDIGVHNSPTAVELASFTATATNTNQVKLKWQTTSELNTRGFNLSRSDAANGTYAKLNAQLIPTQGTGGIGLTSYSFADDSVTSGHTYFYKLEDVSSSGAATPYGPISVTVNAPAACSGALSAAALLAPAPGATTKAGPVTLDWRKVDCATTYRLILRADSNSGEVIDRAKDLTQTKYVTKALSGKRTYFWQVTACNSGGDCTHSDWNSFTVSKR